MRQQALLLELIDPLPPSSANSPQFTILFNILLNSHSTALKLNGDQAVFIEVPLT